MQQIWDDIWAFFSDPIGFIQTNWATVAVFFRLVLTLVILFVAYVIVVRVARRSLKAVGMGPEATGGVRLIVRVIFFIIALLSIVGNLDTDTGTLLSITTVFGTAIGLAFSTSLSNIVSGLYVLFSRPFKVGDYIKIGGYEGIVREITLNYTAILLADETRQLIPNNKVVSGEITNYRIRLEDYVETGSEESSARGRLGSALGTIRDLATVKEAYRYTFDLTFDLTHDHNRIVADFEDVFDKWEERFVARPNFMVWSKGKGSVTYRLAFIVEKPKDIMDLSSGFMRDLIQVVYDKSA
ncbi:mechanosensitive ion channel [Candidatus Thorarchaeota archaeon]|nr:MAG: mechanosensitive ion channel [Candidatus Thorarchaeota archaeon]